MDIFTNTGGDKDWRHVAVKDDNAWRLKYIRIYRVGQDLVVCDSNHYALRKSYFVDVKDVSKN